MTKAQPAFIDNNPKCYSVLTKKATLQNNTLPLMITNNSDNKVCIPKDIRIGISELIDNDSVIILRLNALL